MTKLSFWQLERSIQERFVASTESAGAPAPLAICPAARDARGGVYAAFGAGALLAGVAAMRFGFGDLEQRYALAPTWFIAVYAGCFVLAAFCFLRAAVGAVADRAVPYRPALYLFPIGVIDARTPEFAVHRIGEGTEARFDATRRCLHVDIAGTPFDFPTADAAGAELAIQTITELRNRLATSGPESSARAQSLLDPLVDNGFKNPFSPSESLRKALPWWAKAWPLLALGLGVLLGGAGFLVRNHLSEARLYAQARAADSTAAYRAYLARGGRRPDVPALLLPRTELRDAARQGTVAAVERYSAAHPNSQIKVEIDAALRLALARELSAAEALGTLGALKDFGARYEQYSFLTPDLERAMNTRVEATLQQLRPALAANQTRLLPFFERLLRYTAKHGPEVALRFQRKPTETLEAAEKALRLSAYFTGEQALPGQYFDANHQGPREAQAAEPLIAALSQHFPRDFVNVHLAPALEADADTKPSVPTVLISYHTELSGAFTSRKPRLALSGIGVVARATFEIPGEPDSLPFKLTVWRAPDLKTISDTSTAAELYDTMAAEAFKRFMKKYLATLFVEH